MKKKERSKKRNNPSENNSDKSSSISTHSVETKTKKKKKVKDRNAKNLEESARLAREFEPLKGRIGKGRLTVSNIDSDQLRSRREHEKA